MPSDSLFGHEVLSVSELTTRLRNLIEGEFGQIGGRQQGEPAETGGAGEEGAAVHHGRGNVIFRSV